MTSSKMISSKGLSYNEMRILWNEGEQIEFKGTNTEALFLGGYPEYRGAAVFTNEVLPELHDTFNSFWLVWGNWQEYELIKGDQNQ